MLVFSYLLICLVKIHSLIIAILTLLVLGLFNVIQFSNSVCNTTSQGDQGLCYTQNECSNMGGRASGFCAQGFGVCCLCNEK